LLDIKLFAAAVAVTRQFPRKRGIAWRHFPSIRPKKHTALVRESRHPLALGVHPRWNLTSAIFHDQFGFIQLRVVGSDS
jgi:hypothetical protein